MDDANGTGRSGTRGLSGLFAAPGWLRDLGQSAWLAVGVTLFVAGAVWILSLTQTIVTPVITAAVVAAVISPLLRGLTRRRVPRAAAAALLLVAMVLLGAAVVYIVLAGITSQLDGLGAYLSAARDTIAGWLTDIGVDAAAADDAKEHVSEMLRAALPALLAGVGEALAGLSSLACFSGSPRSACSSCSRTAT